MAYTASFSVNVGDPTKATDISTLAANDDYLKAAADAIMHDSATPTAVLKSGVSATTQSAGNNTTLVATTAFVTAAVAASSTSPAGSNTQVQYNNDGSFGASGNLTFNGSVLAIADGSAAAPSLTNTDDANTGVLFSAADNVGISTAGTQRVWVNENGALGVGQDPVVSDNSTPFTAYNATNGKPLMSLSTNPNSGSSIKCNIFSGGAKVADNGYVYIVNQPETFGSIIVTGRRNDGSSAMNLWRKEFLFSTNHGTGVLVECSSHVSGSPGNFDSLGIGGVADGTQCTDGNMKFYIHGGSTSILSFENRIDDFCNLWWFGIANRDG